MIPQSILEYLQRNDIAFEKLEHPRAVGGQELAAATHVSGHRVAKSVLVEADGKTWLAVLPASERVDLSRLADALGARGARFLDENELGNLFPDCELGAEPPFGRKYGLPVLVDSALEDADTITVRAGSHREALRMRWADYAALEQPRVASFGFLAGAQAPRPQAEARP